jgi:cyanophycinase-like exopeptidase
MKPSSKCRFRPTRPAVALGALLAIGALYAAEQANAQLMLTDGQLAVCSSMRPEACRGRPDWPDQALTATRYRIERARIVRWALAQQLTMEHTALSQWTEGLLSLGNGDSGALSRRDFIATLERLQNRFDTPGSAIIASDRNDDHNGPIDEAVLNGLLDFFQHEQRDRRERVALDQSTDRAAVSILTDFVERAAGISERERPLVAISTAAARDPYAELAYYRQVFKQAGADVVWLPLDAAVQRARSEANCLDLARYQVLELGVHDRQRHAPERFREQIVFCLDRNAGIERVVRIDALFLNGGNVARVLKSFHGATGRATAELEVLRRRLSDRKVLVGGAGAGAIVHSAGRLGTLPFGLITTEFSTGQGQIVMARDLIDRNHRYGLGIDTSSAVFVDRLSERAGYRLEARGRTAAWLLDRGPEAADSRADASPRAVVLRRLNAGESMEFDPSVGLVAESPSVPAYHPDDCRTIGAKASFNDIKDLEPRTPGGSVICYRRSLSDGTQVDWLIEPAVATASRERSSLLIIRNDSVVAPAAPD